MLTILEAKNPRWASADQTYLDVDVMFEGYEAFGLAPFTTCATADTEHGLELWLKANAGEYGPIAAYVPQPIIFPNLTARQLRLGLNSLGKLAAVDTAINQLPEPAKSEAKIEWEFASTFRRDHPLILQIATILGLNDEQVDAVWMEYSTV
ncbi:hypothetical protein OIV19_20125 [Brucella sp. HL-2]|nr:hypothetical protein [Brucella sp. HL-2]MCV9909910.1 hypothetical protein [Brucella sp. HL-2]